MVSVSWVVRQAVDARRGIPVTAIMGVLRLAELVPAGRGVDDGAPAPSGVVVAETDVQASGVLKRRFINIAVSTFFFLINSFGWCQYANLSVM